MAIAWLPEGTTTQPDDDPMRSMWKMSDLYASFNPGGGGSGNNRITEEGDTRLTEDGNSRVTQS